ncbi:hypothetical protein KM043_003579 [Ampulex compressa]|nr:hypothetical protein KM043_003579 [Ampulex compressa]
MREYNGDIGDTRERSFTSCGASRIVAPARRTLLIRCVRSEQPESSVISGAGVCEGHVCAGGTRDTHLIANRSRSSQESGQRAFMHVYWFSIVEDKTISGGLVGASAASWQHRLDALLGKAVVGEAVWRRSACTARRLQGKDAVSAGRNFALELTAHSVSNIGAGCASSSIVREARLETPGDEPL